MAQALCRIIISGQLQAGKNRQSAIRDLAALFKCPPEKAAALLAGKPVPLNRTFDTESAKKYAARLLQIGVKCAIQAVSGEAAGGARPAAAGAARKPDSELLQIVGAPNAEYFRKTFRKFEARDGKFALQWNKHAFFLPFAWFSYRRMPVAAAAVWLCYAILPRAVAPLLHVICGFSANFFYFRSLQHRLDQLPKGDEQAKARVMASGGVARRPVMAAAGIAYLLIAIYMVLPLVPALAKVFSNEGRLEREKVEKLEADRQKDLLGAARSTLTVKGEAIRGRIYEFEAKGKSIGVPASGEQLQQFYELEPQVLRDAWDQPLIYRKTPGGFSLQSIGPDQKADTDDDIHQEIKVELLRPEMPPPGVRPRPTAAAESPTGAAPPASATGAGDGLPPQEERVVPPQYRRSLSTPGGE